jgi:cytochrome P450
VTETASPREPHEPYGWPSAQFTACPYPYYAQLQEETPVCHLPRTRTYLVSRWADIAQVAQNSDVFQQPPLFPQLEPHFEVPFPTVDRYTPQATVTTNGAEHKVKRAWGLRLVERERLRSYEPLVAAIADDLIDLFIDNHRCEFRWDFAERLPAYVMMDLLGLPRKDAAMFMADEFVPDQAEQMIYSSYACALEVIQLRLETKTDDFISEILWDQVSRDGAVDINYQVAQLINLIGAGSETTAHLLTNTMLLLCRHPPVLERVRADRSLLRPLIEESMRLETPVQWLPRLATANAVVGGVDIPAGSTVWLLWGAGNRDPDRWEAPDEFRIDRPSLAQHQLGFGRGPHLCLGAPLARLESVIAFDRILNRLQNLRLLEDRSDLTNVMKSPPSALEGIYDASGCMRGPKTLAIAFDRAL